jgi:hypothetical protein
MFEMKLEEFEETQGVILQIPKNCLPEGIKYENFSIKICDPKNFMLWN